MTTDFEKYYRVHCTKCGRSTYGNRAQYDREMNDVNATWRCLNPECGRANAIFDDDYWEENQEKLFGAKK